MMHPAVPRQMYGAGGALSGTLQDASADLTKQQAPDGSLWAWNPAMNQWQLVHELAAGETIWNLLPGWYGSQSLALVHAVRDVPQNLPILGSNAAQAYPGDVILVPNLQAPMAPPPSPTTPPTPDLVIDPSNGGNGGTTPAPNGGTAPAPNGTTPAPNGGTTPNGTAPNGNGATNGEKPSWWTPGRTAGVAIAGVAAVGLTGWLIARRMS